MQMGQCIVDLHIPQGNFYLADNGFGVCDSLLVPYHSIQYHLAELGHANIRYITIPFYITFIHLFIHELDPQIRKNF